MVLVLKQVIAVVNNIKIKKKYAINVLYFLLFPIKYIRYISIIVSII